MGDYDLTAVRNIVAQSTSEEQRLQAVCEWLHRHVPYYHWVGIYRAEPESKTLVLGPFVGEPTEHVRIPYGRGICGQAAEKLQTVVVQDVTAEENYLACSLAVKAEIVVPIFWQKRFIGELDIDSHNTAPFTAADRQFLEQIAELIAPLVVR